MLITWVFFRAANFTEAWQMLRALAGAADGAGSGAPRFRLFEIAVVAVGMLAAAIEPGLVRWFERHGIGGWWRVPFPLRGVAYAALVLVVVAFGGVTQKFIYFDF